MSCVIAMSRPRNPVPVSGVPFKSKPWTQGGETAVRLMLHYHYFMGLYYSLTFFEVDRDEPYVRTLATNGVSVWVNPGFWEQLNRNQRVTAVAHEMGHKMLLHSTRRGGRDRYIWNIAGDYVINLMLIESGFTPLDNMKTNGKDWSWYADPKYAGWTTEAVYDDIVQDYEDREKERGRRGPKGKPGEADGEGAPGEGDPGDGNQEAKDEIGEAGDLVDFGKDPSGGQDETEGSAHGKESMEEFEGRVRREVKDMEQQARLAGNTPSWIKRAVENADHTKVRWYDALEQYMLSLAKSEYSFHRWQKREFVKFGIIAPDRFTPALGRVRLYVDCSGSCWHALGAFNRHTADIWEQVTPSAVDIRYFQTSVNHEYDQTFERGDGEVELHQLGGGGTDFSWLAREEEAEEHPADLILILTDMEAGFGEAPDAPVIWLSVSGIERAPFGDVISIN